jgi:hypothetical protein
MKSIEELARDAGLETSSFNMGAASCVWSKGCGAVTRADLEKFAALIRADAIERWKDAIAAIRTAKQSEESPKGSGATSIAKRLPQRTLDIASSRPVGVDAASPKVDCLSLSVPPLNPDLPQHRPQG